MFVQRNLYTKLKFICLKSVPYLFLCTTDLATLVLHSKSPNHHTISAHHTSVWPHLLLDICRPVSCVSINVLETPGEWLVFALFWWFCTVSFMILPYLGLYWSVWPHLLLDICLPVSCMLINLLGQPVEWLILVLCTGTCLPALLEYICIDSMQQCYKYRVE
jgi:hypothetical protein